MAGAAAWKMGQVLSVWFLWTDSAAARGGVLVAVTVEIPVSAWFNFDVRSRAERIRLVFLLKSVAKDMFYNRLQKIKNIEALL